MATMALFSPFTPRRSVDRNDGTALRVGRILAWSSLDQRFAHYLSTRSVQAKNRRADTSWTRLRSTHEESSNRPGSHLPKSGPTSKPRTILAKSPAIVDELFVIQYKVEPALHEKSLFGFFSVQPP